MKIMVVSITRELICDFNLREGTQVLARGKEILVTQAKNAFASCTKILN